MFIDAVKLRPILTSQYHQDKTIGYALSDDLLMTYLSEHELLCVSKKKLNLRNLKAKSGVKAKKNFFIPDFCFIGSLLDLSEGEPLSLRDISSMLSEKTGKTKAKKINANFNKYFPKEEKDYFYFYRLKELNKPALMYLNGVKLVASILYQSIAYRDSVYLKESDTFQKIINESGISCLLTDKLLEVMPDYNQFYSYRYIPHKDDFEVYLSKSNNQTTKSTFTQAVDIESSSLPTSDSTSDEKENQAVSPTPQKNKERNQNTPKKSVSETPSNTSKSISEGSSTAEGLKSSVGRLNAKNDDVPEKTTDSESSRLEGAGKEVDSTHSSISTSTEANSSAQKKEQESDYKDNAPRTVHDLVGAVDSVLESQEDKPSVEDVDANKESEHESDEVSSEVYSNTQEDVVNIEKSVEQEQVDDDSSSSFQDFRSKLKNTFASSDEWDIQIPDDDDDDDSGTSEIKEDYVEIGSLIKDTLKNSGGKY